MASAGKELVAFWANEELSEKLDELGRAAGGNRRSTSLRLLVAAATPESLPRSWTAIGEAERRLIEVAEGR